MQKEDLNQNDIIYSELYNDYEIICYIQGADIICTTLKDEKQTHNNVCSDFLREHGVKNILETEAFKLALATAKDNINKGFQKIKN